MTISNFIKTFDCLPAILYILPDNEADYKDTNGSWDTIWDDKTEAEIAYLDTHYEVKNPEFGISCYGSWDEGEIAVTPKA